MNPQELWEELKRRRVVRVVVAYAMAVFVVLQVADLTFEPLGLPSWSYRLLVVLSLAGFPVAVALAWAFDLTRDGVVGDVAGSGPGAARAAGAGRWVVGVAALVALGVGIWRFAGGSDPVVAEGIDAELVAVVPFRVASNDERVTILREGVLDLLAPVLSTSPRSVDTGAMISAWQEYAADEESDLSDDQAVELARRMGAGRVIVGSVVGSAESFAVNARLLRVPGGDVIGSASVDGSSDRLRETVAQLGAQILSMEAGVDRGQVDYLSGVPLDALEAYLEGRRLYRQSRYMEARTAFTRALDADSTFALAALGAWEAVAMGIDADRVGLQARAERTLRAHKASLPPRDRIYADLLPIYGVRRSGVEFVRESGARMVTELPDKAEAWYQYGDQLFHRSWLVSEPDWGERAAQAFRRAEELDPGLLVAKEHLYFQTMFRPDTAGVRSSAREIIAASEDSYTAWMARATLAYGLGDMEARAALEAALPTMSYDIVQTLPMVSTLPYATITKEEAEALFDRSLATAIAERDRRQVLEFQYRYYRAEGLAEDADRMLRRLESTFGSEPSAWVADYLYWGGPEAPAARAAVTLAERVGSGGPLPDGSQTDACFLELWRLRTGDLSRVDGTVARLRAAAGDPDPAHGGSALCALVLESMAAHRRGSPAAEELTPRLVAAVDDGPPDFAPVTLETAWLLEDRGDLAAAARVAGYMFQGTPFNFAESTRHREAGRLWDAAGDLEKAAWHYRWYLGFRDVADNRFQADADSVRARLAEIEGR